jgi:hypothetical protein
MQPSTLPLPLQQETVDQCNFGHIIRKTTNIYHDSTWEPKGKSNNGRCQGKCGQGHWVNNRFIHDKALGVEPRRAPQGQGSTRIRNSVASGLLEEIVTHALTKSTNPKARIILDLCSGFQSLRPIATRLGCSYIAVDLVGDRNRHLKTQPPTEILNESLNVGSLKGK